MEPNTGHKRGNDASQGHVAKRQKEDIFPSPSVNERQGPWRPLHEASPRIGGLQPPSSIPQFPYSMNEFSVPRNQFVYEAFPPASRNIRLLKISQGGDLYIQAFPIDAAPNFAAVSYLWGCQEERHQILLNGKSFNVRPNLYSMLETLSKRKDNANASYIWIDAICINQDSFPDKSEQVQMMGEIYAKAANVIIWLGEADTDSKVAMQFIPQLLSPGYLNQTPARWETDSQFIAFAGLLRRSYWSRAWVIQEMAFAKSVTIICGDQEVNGNDFCDAVSVFAMRRSRIQKALELCPLHRNHTTSLEGIFSPLGSSMVNAIAEGSLHPGSNTVSMMHNSGLEYLVTDFHTAECVDPRDRIYAFLSLCSNSSLKADYSRSVLDTFSEFISECIRSSGSLDILDRPWAPVRRTKWHKQFVDPDVLQRTPSWIRVLDDLPFGRPSGQNCQRIRADNLVGRPRQKIYNANNGVQAGVRFGRNQNDMTYDGSLSCKGIELADIVEISTRMADGVILSEYLNMVGGITYDSSGRIQSMDNRVWRILCANRDHKGKAAPSIYRIALLHLLQRVPRGSSLDIVDLLEEGQADHIQDLLQRLQKVVWNRKIFKAVRRKPCPSELASVAEFEEETVFGLAPREARPGDKICILLGGSVPFLLREHSQDMERAFELVGDSYVDGFMDGEAFTGADTRLVDSLVTEFTIW